MYWNYVTQSEIWTQLGDSFVVSGISGTAQPFITQLNDNQIAFAEGRSNTIRTMEWDSSAETWSQTGNTYNLSFLGLPAIGAITSSRIALVDDGNIRIRNYAFDGINWDTTATESSAITGIDWPGVAVFDSSNLAFTDAFTPSNELYFNELSGGIWKPVKTVNIFPADTFQITDINNKNLALIANVYGSFNGLYYLKNDPTTVTQIGSAKIIGDTITWVTKLTETEIATITCHGDSSLTSGGNGVLPKLSRYEWLSATSEWVKKGTTYEIASAVASGSRVTLFTIAALNENTVALYDNTTNKFRTIGFSN